MCGVAWFSIYLIIKKKKTFQNFPHSVYGPFHIYIHTHDMHSPQSSTKKSCTSSVWLHFLLPQHYLGIRLPPLARLGGLLCLLVTHQYPSLNISVGSNEVRASMPDKHCSAVLKNSVVSLPTEILFTLLSKSCLSQSSIYNIKHLWICDVLKTWAAVAQWVEQVD